jgi:hypothetical protein
MIYKKKKPKASFGMDLGQLNTKDALGTGAISAIGDFASKAVMKAGTRDLGYGVKHTAGAARMYGGYLSGATKGADIGMKFGGVYGAAIGAVGGAAIGLGKGIVDTIKNPKDLAFMTRDSLQSLDVADKNSQGASFYNELEQKQVMKTGGEIPDGEDQPVDSKAIILGGKRHKDGGNDILDEQGNKIAETEREEIIFTKEQTDIIDQSVKRAEDGDYSAYLELGSYIKELITNRTEDQSGKFKTLNNVTVS